MSSSASPLLRHALVAAAAGGVTASATWWLTSHSTNAAAAGASDAASASASSSAGITALLPNLAAVDVLRYTVTFAGDLMMPQRLGANPRDTVKRLLAMVWSGGDPGGRHQDADPARLAQARAEARRTRRLVWLLAAVGVGQTWLLNRSADSLRALSTAVYEPSRARGDAAAVGAFRRGLRHAALLAVVGSALGTVTTWATEELAVRWRALLTRHIHGLYFRMANFYHLANLPGRQAIADPDERLAREVYSVCKRLANMVSLLVRSAPPIVWFTWRMWRARGATTALIPHLWLLLAYEVAQRLFPKNIGELYRGQAQAKAVYSKGAARTLQAHAEAIAALSGDARERTILQDKSIAVMGATRALHVATSTFGLTFKLCYTYGARSWLSSFLLWPLLRAGNASSKAAVSEVRFAAGLMIEMLIANGQLLTLHANAMHMVGTTRRLCVLMDTLQTLVDKGAAKRRHAVAAAGETAVVEEGADGGKGDDDAAAAAEAEADDAATTTHMVDGDAIRFDGVDVHTPTGHMLVRDLSFAVQAKENLLLTGANGAGKSSIFRCLGGLWSIRKGVITKPGASQQGLHADIYYLPQKPYNTLGTLRDQLTYPLEPTSAGLTDDHMARLLALVDLSHLWHAYLDTPVAARSEAINWQEHLSLGEQQRLAMARLFFHRPTFAILDECTSAVSTAMETLLYDTCLDMGIAYITICHRPALMAFHDRNLHLTGDGEGGWRMQSISRDEFPRPRTHRRPDRGDTTASVRDLLQHSSLSGSTDGAAASPAAATAGSAEHWTAQRTAEWAATAGASSSSSSSLAVPKRSSWSTLAALARVALPGSYAQLLALLGAIGARTCLAEAYSWLGGQLFRATLESDARAFAVWTGVSLLSDVVTGSVEEAVIFLQNRVALTWQANLSRHAIGRLFAHKAFYRLHTVQPALTDADARLTDDVSELSDALATILGAAITPVVDLSWFSWRLRHLVSSSGGSVVPLYGYMGATWAVLKVLMPDHESVRREEKRLESRFRFVHTRLVNHAESVAFFGGDEREHAIAESALSQLLHHQHHTVATNAAYRFVARSLTKDSSSPSNAVSAPDLLTFWLQGEHTSRRFGTDMTPSDLVRENYYLRQATSRTVDAFGKLSEVYEAVVALMGSAGRVQEMLDVVHALGPAAGPLSEAVTSDDEDLSVDEEEEEEDEEDEEEEDGEEEGEASSLGLDNVTLLTPAGVCLAQGLSVDVGPHQGLLVTGPNGCGKTSLFRVLSGLWRVPDTGRVVSPGPRHVFLVPQRCYSVEGSLVDQVTYPKHLVEITADAEARLLAILGKVGIVYLVEREGGWHTVRRWETTLSLGEQQRMGLARLLWHRPAYGVMDECTDAVSMEQEEALYAAIHEAGVTPITISKRLALPQFHTQQLRLGVPSKEGWEVTPL